MVVGIEWPFNYYTPGIMHYDARGVSNVLMLIF